MRTFATSGEVIISVNGIRALPDIEGHPNAPSSRSFRLHAATGRSRHIADRVAETASVVVMQLEYRWTADGS